MAGSQRLDSFMPLTSGDFTLTEMQDGTLRILLHGIPCTDHRWKPTEMHIARRKFDELKACLSTGAEQETNVDQQEGHGWLPRSYNAAPRFGRSSYH
jgi:hypothetical protein